MSKRYVPLISLVLAVALLILLGGCESDVEKAERHDQLCRGYGAQRGTPEYIQCRATIHVTEVQRERERASAAAAGAAIGAASASGGYRR